MSPLSLTSPPLSRLAALEGLPSLALRLYLVPVFWMAGMSKWQAIADASAPFANTRVEAAAERIAQARELLRTHGDYDWLTASGPMVILNNGIEFAATIIVMLLALLWLGDGRYASIDYWLEGFTLPSRAGIGLVRG